MNRLPSNSIQTTIGVGWHEVPLTEKISPYGISFNDSDVEAIISALTFSSYPYGGDRFTNFREYYIGKFITELKADLGITKMTDMFDCFYMFVTATHSDALINWAQPGKYDAEIIGTLGTGTTQLRFDPNIGFSNNDTTSVCAINTKFNPFIEPGANYGKYLAANGAINGSTQSTGSFGIYLTQKFKNAGSWYEIGACSTIGTSGQTTGTLLGTRVSGGGLANQTICNLLMGNMGSLSAFSSGPLSYVFQNGLYSAVRDDAANIDFYFNGQCVYRHHPTNGGFGSIAIPLVADRGPITICAPNVNATGLSVSIGANLASRRQVSFCYIGSSAIKPEIVYYRVQQYLDAIGYNPVPGGSNTFNGINLNGNL